MWPLLRLGRGLGRRRRPAQVHRLLLCLHAPAAAVYKSGLLCVFVQTRKLIPPFEYNNGLFCGCSKAQNNHLLKASAAPPPFTSTLKWNCMRREKACMKHEEGGRCRTSMSTHSRILPTPQDLPLRSQSSIQQAGEHMKSHHGTV